MMHLVRLSGQRVMIFCFDVDVSVPVAITVIHQ